MPELRTAAAASAATEQAALDARRYLGEELDLFIAAHAWRRYWAGHVAPCLGPRVLEVGAGLGSTTLALWRPGLEQWLAVEPDPDLAQRLESRLAPLGPPAPRVHRGTLATLPADARFDTALYIDVLEHLPDDAAEVARAARFLAPGGRLIALSPAHPWLFSPFDRAIGHLRRYTRRSLAAVVAGSLTVERAFHLDAGGALLSLGNRLLLRRRGPSAGQIAFWNRVVVPLSRVADPLLLHRLGRSVVVIARKPP
jgi:SAM-dependent methyltransferase